jgi:type I restriction enzyme S subunit
MEKTKVRTLIRQVRGVSYKPEDLHNELDDNSVILLRANNIDEGKINFDDVVYVDKSKVSDEQYLKDGDILICASSGSKNLVGKAASIRLNMECTFGAFCKVVRPKEGIEEYLGVYFQSPIYRRKISEVAIGANINNIRNEHIDELDIPVFSNDEQVSIAKRMHLIQEVISNRKAELEKLDDLIKARFVEMFGDPISNPKGWDRIELGRLTDVGSSKRIFEKEYVSEGIPFYRTKEIVELSKGNSISTELYITEERFSEIKEKYGTPKAGDLLISAVGTIGIIWIVDGKNDFYFKDGNLIKVDSSEKFNSVYMKNLLEYLIDEYKKQMSSGTAYAALTISGLVKMKVYDVPLKLQDEFAAFVHQVDKSKVVVQKALDETQILFNSLMQQYFG